MAASVLTIVSAGCTMRRELPEEDGERLCQEIGEITANAERELSKSPHTLKLRELKKAIGARVASALEEGRVCRTLETREWEHGASDVTIKLVGICPEKKYEHIYVSGRGNGVEDLSILGLTCQEVKRFVNLAIIDRNNDDTITRGEYLIVHPEVATREKTGIQIDNSGAVRIPEKEIPVEMLTALEIARHRNTDAMNAAREVHAVLDNNTDGIISMADDIDANGIINVQDGILYRKIIDHLHKKYGQSYDRSRTTVSDVIFAMMDLDAVKLPVEYTQTMDFGFEPYKERNETQKDETTLYRDNSKVMREVDPEMAGLGAAAGLGIARLMTKNPVGLVLGAIIGGAGSAESTRTVQDVTKEITTMEYLELITESSESVRVAVVELVDGWKVFIFDASKITKETTIVETVRKYHNGELESAKRKEVSHSFSNTSLSQETSGRWAVQAPASFGGRVAIFQEPRDGNMPDFKGIFEIADFGHNDRVGRSEDHKMLASRHIGQLTNIIKKMLPRLPKYVAGIKSFDPVAGMKREAETLKELDALSKAKVR